MKTLEQVEPRTPLSAGGTISSPGAYYLTNHISGRFFISADDVDLDLNGYTLSNGSGLELIRFDGRRNIRVHGGTLFNGDTYGIVSNTSGDILLSDLTLSTFANDCIRLQNPTGPIRVERVHCSNAGWSGIFVRQTSTNTLRVEIRDSSFVNNNVADNLTIAGLTVAHIGTGEMYAVISGNRVIDNRTWGINVICSECVGVGEVSDNTLLGNKTVGLIVNADLLVIRNRAVGSPTNHNVTSSLAAPFTAIGNSPGPWDNITE